MKWSTVPLSEITEVITKGTTPTTLGEKFTDTDVKFIKAEALNGDSNLDVQGISYISASVHEKLKRSILKEGDVLVTIAGAKVGKCGFVREEHLPCNTYQAVGIVRADRLRSVPRFLYYFFNQPCTFARCQSIGAAQAAQPNVNPAILRGFPVPYLPIKQQERIASILTAYEDLIENNRRRMALLEETARKLYREWFIRLRFPGHEHTPIRDGLPAGWERKALGEVAVINRTNLSKSFDAEIEYIDISAVTPGRINETTRYRFSDAPSRARRVVQHGDILWSCVRPNRKSHAVVWNPVNNLIASTGFAVITPNGVPISFLEQATTTNDFVRYLENNAKGAAYPSVLASDFERAELLIPTRPVLDAFATVAEPLLAQRHNLETQTRKLRAARDRLLPKLMSGEIEV